jgi:L-rhamnose mutarotase
MERMGHVIQLNGDIIDEYKRIHAAVRPAVLKAISEPNIRDYTIPSKSPKTCCSPIGKITDPMQTPLEARKPGEWWAQMENMFHTD